MTFGVFTLVVSLSAGSAGAMHVLQDSASSLYFEGREQLIDEHYDRAREIFERIVTQFPASEEADDAQYYIGYSCEQLERYDEAIAAFSTLIEEWPDSTRVESARSHRAELVARRGRDAASSEILDDIFGGSSPWELKRDTAVALAREGNLSAVDVLQEIMERESTSRQTELIRVLSTQTRKPEARRILIAALEPGRSTSVQLRALTALEPVAEDEEVAQAMAATIGGEGSTSVSLQALRALSKRLDEPRVRRAASRGLDPAGSTSVQILACTVLADYLLTPEVRPAVLQMLQASTSTSPQLKCLQGLEAHKDDLAAADVVRAAVDAESNSTSVKLEAVRIAAASKKPEVRAAAVAGLRPGNSTSVQLRAVQSLGSGRNDEATAEALASLFEQSGVSTTVLLSGLESLANHLQTQAGPRALTRALRGENSTSVQLKAIEIAAPLGSRKEIRDAIATSLRPDASTSVLLKAVDALGQRTEDADTRRALIRTLEDRYSTSVVLASLEALGTHVASDPSVRDAFARTMENEEISSSARIRAAAQLLPTADPAMKRRIAEAMENVVMRARRNGSFGNSNVIEKALDVLESADPERAERLRRRSGRSELEEGSSRTASVWFYTPYPSF